MYRTVHGTKYMEILCIYKIQYTLKHDVYCIMYNLYASLKVISSIHLILNTYSVVQLKCLTARGDPRTVLRLARVLKTADQHF